MSYLGETPAEWFARQSRGRDVGSQIFNTWLDHHCSRTSVEVGAGIAAIWGPLAPWLHRAWMRGLQTALNCTLWNEARALHQQLRDGGMTNVTRHAAMNLVQTRQWVRDPRSGRFVRNVSPSFLDRLRPFALPAAIGLVAVAVVTSD